MKTKKQARVIYNSDNDSFEIELLDGGTWELDCGYKCRFEENNWIHYSIITELKKLQLLGYEIIFW